MCVLLLKLGQKKSELSIFFSLKLQESFARNARAEPLSPKTFWISPSVPNKYLNIKNTNAHDIKHTSSADEDENNNKANTDDKQATNYGNRF